MDVGGGSASHLPAACPLWRHKRCIHCCEIKHERWPDWDQRQNIIACHQWNWDVPTRNAVINQRRDTRTLTTKRQRLFIASRPHLFRHRFERRFSRPPPKYENMQTDGRVHCWGSGSWQMTKFCSDGCHQIGARTGSLASFAFRIGSISMGTTWRVTNEGEVEVKAGCASACLQILETDWIFCWIFQWQLASLLHFLGF